MSAVFLIFLKGGHDGMLPLSSQRAKPVGRLWRGPSIVYTTYVLSSHETVLNCVSASVNPVSALILYPRGILVQNMWQDYAIYINSCETEECAYFICEFLISTGSLHGKTK